jgi:hypothetical protein
MRLDTLPSKSLAGLWDNMTRSDAITRAQQMLRSGDFLSELDRRVAYQTESQNAGRSDVLWAYLERELKPSLAELGFENRVIESPSGRAPFLLAERKEKPSVPPCCCTAMVTSPTAWQASGATA